MMKLKRSAGPNVPNASCAAITLAAAHDPVFCEAGKEKAPAWFRLVTGALSGSSAPQEHRGTNAIPLSLSSTVTAPHNSPECDFSAKALRHGAFGQIALATEPWLWPKNAHDDRSPRFVGRSVRSPAGPHTPAGLTFCAARFAGGLADQFLRTAAAVAQHNMVRPTKPIRVGSKGKPPPGIARSPT